eukprot:8269974-Pyramimonas_sp.AAC.1
MIKVDSPTTIEVILLNFASSCANNGKDALNIAPTIEDDSSTILMVASPTIEVDSPTAHTWMPACLQSATSGRSSDTSVGIPFTPARMPKSQQW